MVEHAPQSMLNANPSGVVAFNAVPAPARVDRWTVPYRRTILDIIGPRYSTMRAENSRAFSGGITPPGGI